MAIPDQKVLDKITIKYCELKGINPFDPVIISDPNYPTLAKSVARQHIIKEEIIDYFLLLEAVKQVTNE